MTIGAIAIVINVIPLYQFARNTSRTCPCCKYITKENRLTQAKFECVLCGYSDNVDLVCAINILAAGHAVLACGESVQLGRSVKQEPAEETMHEYA